MHDASKRANKGRRRRFPLTSDQYELLLAMEAEGSAAAISKTLGRDASVVSRAMKALAETAPVLEKVDGRWQLSPLGRQFNRLAESFIDSQERLLAQAGALRLSPPLLPSSRVSSALLLIGGQCGFQSPAWGPRNNPDVESLMQALLRTWRDQGQTVVLCRHLSREKGSPLRAGTRGCDWLPALAPRPGEPVVEKSSNSAFSGTTLAADLRNLGIDSVVLAGFTTNMCITATACAAYEEGFTVYVVADATATFDRVGPDGRAVKAHDLHASALATLHQEYATVVDAAALLESPR